MPDVTDTIPRGDLTIEQRRRIGSLQAAKEIVYGTRYNTPVVVHELLRVARYVEKGTTDG